MNSSTMNATVVNNETQSSDRFPRSEGIAYCVAFLLESLTIIIGNAIFIAVFTTTRQLRKRKFYFLVNLAIADFLVGAIAVPILVYYLAKKFELWEYKRNFQAFVAADSIHLLVTYASLVNLMMVSLERMYAILWPLKHRVLETRTYYVLIGFSWILPLFPTSVNIMEHYRLISLNAFIYIWLSFTSLLLLIICISYISIWIEVKFGQHHVTTAQDRKLTMSLFIVTAVSLVTWLPGVVVTVDGDYFADVVGNTYNHIHSFVALLAFANSLVNPIIYSFRMPQFRQAALHLVCRRSAERRVPAIEMRNEAEVVNHQACAVISRHPESNMAVDNLQFDTWL